MSNSFNISVKPEIAAVEAKVDIIDTEVDAIRAIDLPAIDTLIDTVDTVVDAIRATDVPALTTIIGNIPTVNRGQLKCIQGAKTDGNYSTLLEITGSGIIHTINIQKVASGNASYQFTIDGIVQIFTIANAQNTLAYNEVATDTVILAPELWAFSPVSIGLEFMNGFKAEYKSDGTNEARLKIIYGED